MGVLTLYAIKSALCLAVLYLPYTLLLRRETFFTFNRCGLLLIIGVSLLVPCLNIPLWDFTMQDFLEQQRHAIVEVGMPVAITSEALATTAQEATGSSAFDWVHLLVYAYLAGFLIFLVLKVRQLYRLLRFIPSGCLWTDKRDGATIYCHAGEVGAFSWMHSIVVGEADSAPDSPVMLHELAHVRHGHSWDALLVAMVEVLQWFNPCIWMLDISLREIHEYEADDAVLRRGITARNYQLLLIKNAVRGSRYAFANAFNHSLLKKRITMMMKKKSSKWARARLLYIVPLTMIVLGAFASHKFVSQTTPLSNGISESAFKQISTALLQEKETVDPTLLEETSQEPMTEVMESEEASTEDAMVEESVGDTIQGKTIDGLKVFDVADEMPEFPGGVNALMNYLTRNVHYPAIAMENGIEGRYIVRFCVTTKGKIANIEIVGKPEGEALSDIIVVGYKNAEDSIATTKRVNAAKGREALEKEAIRVVEDMPDWKPGMVKGEAVNCLFALPITFRLQ